MLRPRAALVALALALTAPLPGCAARVQHHAEYSQDEDFSRIETYAWIRDEELLGSLAAAEVRDPVALEAMIRAAIERELADKGLKKVAADGADILVHFSVGIRSTEVAIGYNADEYGLVWHSKDAEYHRRGELSVDLFDRASRRHIWHGSAAKRITHDDEAAVLVDRAVVLIFSQFPPPPAGT